MTTEDKQYMRKRNSIKNDLIAQLKENDAYRKYFIDLVEDYMSLWDIKNKLIDDIEERGVTVAWQNSETQMGHKKNDSVSELNKTNAQMLKVLSELGIKVLKKDSPNSSGGNTNVL